VAHHEAISAAIAAGDAAKARDLTAEHVGEAMARVTDLYFSLADSLTPTNAEEER
jgi:DNA-binding GntR family transcriptional regulator